MSHFVEMQVEFEVQHEDVLLRVLQETYGNRAVEMSENGMALRGYYAREAGKCNIVVHASQDSSYEFGFVRQPNGKYRLFHDSDDRQNTEKLRTTVKQNYVVRVAEKAMVLNGYTPEIQKQPDGTIQLLAYV